MKELLPYNAKLKECARKLRQNSTPAEKLLWSFLRRRQLDGEQWYRQKPLGNFVVDFYCPKRKLVIEADGGQHSEWENRECDESRTAFLESELGLRVLRFRNHEILADPGAVQKRILKG